MKYLIPVLVGAVIGYITNWLAIKMLFKPYTEKRFLGILIPFTPGLIPKEMNRIAKSIGEAIGEYILSPDVVSDVLSSDDAKLQIKNWTKSMLQRFKQSHDSVKDIITKNAGEKYNEISAYIKIKITEFICTALKSQVFRNYINGKIGNLIFDGCDNTFYKELREKLNLFLKKVLSEDDLRKSLADALDEKLLKLSENNQSLNEVIPECIINMLKSYIIENDEYIVKFLRETVESPVMKLKIKLLISELAQQNMSKVITLFINPGSIADWIFDSIEKYIDNPSNSKSIIMIFTTSIDKLMQSCVSDIFSNVSPELKEQGINDIVDLILGFVREEKNQNRFIRFLEDNIKSMSDYVKDDIAELTDSIIYKALESPILEEYVKEMVKDAVDWIMKQPVCSLVKGVDNLMIDRYMGFIDYIFEVFVKNRLPYLVQFLDIPKIVEDRINNFDVVFAEKIIIDIANKELKAITWLGALLGGIMGLLTPLIQLLY